MLQFGGSPWARRAFLVDPERAARLAREALRLGVNVGVVGKGEQGPWVVRVQHGPRSLRFAGARIHDTVEFGLARWEAGADDTAIRWTAGADSLAHAHRRTDPRTLCGQSPVDERMAHPERHRCTDCWRALDGRLVAA
jgi:hypothetical protein